MGEKIMTVTLIASNNCNTTNKISDDHFRRPSFKVFGHNGLSIGDWWPMQICVLRDGAHGSRMGGISGSIEEGAWSIIVSGKFSLKPIHYLTTDCV
jgi:hypothetical protein